MIMYSNLKYTKKFLIVRSNTVSIILQISDYIFQIIFVKKKQRKKKENRNYIFTFPRATNDLMILLKKKNKE